MNAKSYKSLDEQELEILFKEYLKYQGAARINMKKRIEDINIDPDFKKNSLTALDERDDIPESIKRDRVYREAHVLGDHLSAEMRKAGHDENQINKSCFVLGQRCAATRSPAEQFLKVWEDVNNQIFEEPGAELSEKLIQEQIKKQGFSKTLLDAISAIDEETLKNILEGRDIKMPDLPDFDKN